LWKAGEAAEPALRVAANSSDLEVATRARAILDKFKYGVYPDTPPEIVKLVTDYRDNPNRRPAVLRQLLQMGGRGYKTLLKLASAEENEHVRRQVFQQIGRQAVRAAPTFIAEGNLPMAEQVLETAAAVDV